MFRGGSVPNVPDKDEILFRIADKQIKSLLEDALLLRWRYDCDFALTRKDSLLIGLAVDLERAASSIAADCADRKLITWDDYKVIRNIIDHIGTGVRMEDIVW